MSFYRFILKCIFFLLVISGLNSSVLGQFVAKMEVKEDIPGLCDKNEVYALFPMFEGQEEAVCPLTESEILERLNNDVQYVKDHPKYKDKGMINLIINCKGELIVCEMDNETKSKELDKQIEDVFKILGEWKAGKLNGKEVDSSKLYSFKIKNGRFIFN